MTKIAAFIHIYSSTGFQNSSRKLQYPVELRCYVPHCCVLQAVMLFFLGPGVAFKESHALRTPLLRRNYEEVPA